MKRALAAIFFIFATTSIVYGAGPSREWNGQFCEKQFAMQEQDIKQGRSLGIYIPGLKRWVRNVNGDRLVSCMCYSDKDCRCCQLDEAKFCAETERLAAAGHMIIRTGCAWEGR